MNTRSYSPVWNPETKAWVEPRWYVSASQGRDVSVVHFATLEQANADFDERKTHSGFARGAWVETTEELPPTVLRKAVWTSIRKNGRPGTLRHVLYIVALNHEEEAR